MKQGENTVINSFFFNLASKFYKENDLSDVTWAMCQASELFLQRFLKFFFNRDFLKTIEIRREISAEEEGARVDFYIEYYNELGERELYLIEAKIGDHNQHFGQYDGAYGFRLNV